MKENQSVEIEIRFVFFLESLDGRRWLAKASLLGGALEVRKDEGAHDTKI